MTDTNDREKLAASLGIDQFVSDLLKTFSRHIIALAIGLGYAVLLARGLGPTGNGIYATAMVLPNIFVHLFNLGVPPANVYFVGKGAYSVGRVLAANLKMWLVTAVIGFAIAVTTITLFSDKFFPGVAPHLLLTTTLLFPAILARTFLNGILHGKQDFVHYNRVLTMIPFLTLLIAAALILLFDFDSQGAMFAVLCAEVAGV
jgi:O-antigen/teichoic acid export membrane protein